MSNMLLTVVILLVAITGVSTECGQRGSQEWYHYSGHCYFKPAWGDLRTFDEAFLRCKELNSYLVSITSRNESQFLVRDVIRCHQKPQCFVKKPNYMFWIGLRKNITERIDGLSLSERRANWTWQNGDMYSWQNWHPETYEYIAEPDNDSSYVRMHASGQWADLDPSSKFRYICEQTAPNRTTNNITPAMPSSRIPTTTQGPGDTSATPATGPSIYIYIGSVLGVLLIVAVAVTTVFVCRRNSCSRKESRRPTTTNHPEYEEGFYLSPGHNPENDPSKHVVGVGRQLSGLYEAITAVTEPKGGPYEELPGQQTSSTYQNIVDALQSSSDPNDDVGAVAQPTYVMGDVPQQTDHDYLELIPDNEYEDLAPANVTYTPLSRRDF